MKTVHIQYFAILREQRGQGGETISTTAQTLDQLYEELRKKYGFSLSTNVLRVSVNDHFSSWKTPLREGDRIVFIPPVAGG